MNLAAGASETGRRRARRAGFIYVSDAKPGIAQQRSGHDFRYLTARGGRLKSRRALRRIAALAVPPAYRDVWICCLPRGHLQATGRDARGRKQFRYHAAWREICDYEKFDRIARFGLALPSLRHRLRLDLCKPGLPKEKVLAVAVALLNETGARVGNLEYARANHSFGITTLRSRHVRFVNGARALLTFAGKRGVRHEILVDNKRIVQVVRRCHALPGQHLFQYLDQEGDRFPIDSGQVNDYLRDAMEGEFTAKDFRTWHATVQALKLLRRSERPASESAGKHVITAVIQEVARALRNTPAVCRRSYINPELFVAWRSGALDKHFGPNVDLSLRREELRVIRFLRSRLR